MPVDQALDDGGADALAAPVDHLLEAAGQPDVTVLVDDGQVAGLEEAVTVEDLGVLLRVLVVAGEDGRPLEQKFALAVRAVGCCRPDRPLCRRRRDRSAGPRCQQTVSMSSSAAVMQVMPSVAAVAVVEPAC